MSIYKGLLNDLGWEIGCEFQNILYEDTSFEKGSADFLRGRMSVYADVISFMKQNAKRLNIDSNQLRLEKQILNDDNDDTDYRYRDFMIDFTKFLIKFINRDKSDYRKSEYMSGIYIAKYELLTLLIDMFENFGIPLKEFSLDKVDPEDILRNMTN